MEAKYIVKSDLPNGKFKFQCVKEVMNLDDETNCIIVESLDPDFTLLLNSIEIIITKTGSKLAHLAIVAREYGKNILQCDEMFNHKIKKSGILEIVKTDEGAEIEIQ